jgi:hypothetical protein
MMEEPAEIRIDSDIVHGTFSTCAPKIEMSPGRLLFRDSMLFLVFKIFLFFFVVGIGVFAYWTKVPGGIFVAIAALLAISIWRYLSLRKIEFKNAVLNRANNRFAFPKNTARLYRSGRAEPPKATADKTQILCSSNSIG